jgi:serine protein kinase
VEHTYTYPDPGLLYHPNTLDYALANIYTPAAITNTTDFRTDVFMFALRPRARSDGRNPDWTSYEKLREVIEKRMFSNVEDLLPVISFGTKKDSDTDAKHTEFVARLKGRGYTERQVRRLVEWYMRVNKAG